MTTTTKWTYIDTKQFIRDYKNLRNRQIQQRVQNGIKDIIEAHNPRTLGFHKVNNMESIYAYEIGQQYRILYEIFDEKGLREVIFYRVGLHNIYKSTIQRKDIHD